MTNPIIRGLALGYSAQKLIGFLSKAFPSLSPKIRQARSQGHTAEQILGFLSKSTDRDLPIGASQQQIHSENTKRQEALVKHGLVAAGGAAATYALSRAMPNMLQQLSGSGNQQPPQPANSIVSPGSTLPPQQPQIQTTQPTNPLQQPPAPSNITQAPQQSQATAIQQASPQVNVSQILSKYPGFASKIEELRKGSYAHPQGNDASNIAAYFHSVHPKETKLLEKDAGAPIEKVIEDYLSSSQNQQTESTPSLNQENKPEIAETPQIQQEEPSKIEKSSTVISPNGVGQVKEIRNGKALIEVDGKKHQVNEEDLISSPIPEKELADLYDDVLRGIEQETGEEVSRNVNWAGYDPNTKELAYRPHNGKLYIYDDISEEDIEELTSILSQRKSTGQNFIGAWKEGTRSPIGARMFQLIQKLQKERGGKGNEYKNRFEVIYDALEPATRALKEKHAKRKKKKA